MDTEILSSALKPYQRQFLLQGPWQYLIVFLEDRRRSLIREILAHVIIYRIESVYIRPENVHGILESYLGKIILQQAAR